LKVFDLYDTWSNIHVLELPGGGPLRNTHEARRAIARGEALFNSKPIQISGVKGLNDDLNMPMLPGTCTTSHDTPNSGNHSIPAPLDIG
jgi:cytochrome c peroxidase